MGTDGAPKGSRHRAALSGKLTICHVGCDAGTPRSSRQHPRCQSLLWLEGGGPSARPRSCCREIFWARRPGSPRSSSARSPSAQLGDPSGGSHQNVSVGSSEINRRRIRGRDHRRPSSTEKSATNITLMTGLDSRTGRASCQRRAHSLAGGRASDRPGACRNRELKRLARATRNRPFDGSVVRVTGFAATPGRGPSSR